MEYEIINLFVCLPTGSKGENEYHSPFLLLQSMVFLINISYFVENSKNYDGHMISVGFLEFLRKKKNALILNIEDFRQV